MRPGLFLVGLIAVFVGLALLSLPSVGGGFWSGGFVLIGPFPMVFGSGANGPALSLLAVLAGVTVLILFLVAALRTRRAVRDQPEEINK